MEKQKDNLKCIRPDCMYTWFSRGFAATGALAKACPKCKQYKCVQANK